MLEIPKLLSARLFSLRRRLIGRLVDWFERILPPRPRTALAWSWWAFKHLYRGGYVLSAFGFLFVWLWFFFGQADFGPVATEFVADLRELGLMAAAALGSASHLVVARLSRLPVMLGVPALALAASYVLYGIARTGRPRRER